MKDAFGYLSRNFRYAFLSSLFLSGLLTISNDLDAQGDQPGPEVEWRAVTWAPTTPGDGFIVSDYGTPIGNTDPDLWTYAPVGPVVAQNQEDSDEDWWQAHTNIYDENGIHIGYVACGFVRWTNWYYEESNGCYMNHHGPFVENEFDQHQQRRGGVRSAIARFDLDGNMLYCRPNLSGIYFDVVQDPDGDLVATGGAFNTHPFADMSQYPLYYNQAGGSNITFASHVCTTGAAGKMNVTKYDLDGNVIWNHLFADADYDGNDIEASLNQNAEGRDLTVRYDGGNFIGYRVVGRCQDPNVQDLPNVARPFAVDLDANGNLIRKKIYGDNYFPGFDAYNEAWAIGRSLETEGEHYAISGIRIASTNAESAWLMYLDDPNSLEPVWHEDLILDNVLPSNQVDPLLNHVSLGAGFVNDGSVKIIWPVQANNTQHVSAGKNIMDGYILKYGLNQTLEASTSVGEIRAYDMQMDMCRTSDGNLAIVSSKWSAGTEADPPAWSGDIENYFSGCLDLYNYDWQNDPNGIYEYWNTDAYVAKLSSTDLTIIWETTFDQEPGEPRACFPDNMKQQECLYKISEADDGGLVVSGNTGGNFDDSYLVKVHPDCQAKVDYSYYHTNYPSDPNILHHYTYVVSGSVTWDVDMNVYGVVIIPDQAELTITSNATIRFADSEKLDERTFIHVQPGGTLRVEDGATLTSISACENSLWDGILASGDEFGSQDLYSNQSHLFLNTGGSIENARVGVLVANDYPPDYSMVELAARASGGVVKAENFTFRNNVRDAVFSPYENHQPGDETKIRMNRSRFIECTFSTDAALSDPELWPIHHVYMGGVRGIVFRGCIWQNTTGGLPYTSIKKLGTGIRAENSSFIVRQQCLVAPPVGSECPDNDATLSSFSGLLRGIFATCFDESRTFTVHRTAFNDNYGGIRMENVAMASITQNSFEVAQPSLPSVVTPPYGVYADECTGYEIEENTFSPVQAQGYVKAGLVIKNSGGDPNRFYNNTFDDFNNANSAAVVIVGENYAGNLNEGLEVRCNAFGLIALNGYDVALTGFGVTVAPMQGEEINHPINDLDNPAGNLFSWSTSYPESDWFVDDASNFVSYFHHEADGFNHVQPAYYSSSYISLEEQSEAYPDKVIACPIEVSHGHQKPQKKNLILSTDTELQASMAVYEITKNSGNTAALIAILEDENSDSYTMRNALLQSAPSVDRQAFSLALERLQNGLLEWHLTQALLACSPLQGDVLQMTFESGMDEFFIALVEQAQGGGGTNILTILEAEQSALAHDRADAFNDLGRWILLDSADVNGELDTLKNWHLAIQDPRNSRALCGIFTAKKDFASMQTLAADEVDNGRYPVLFGVQELLASAQLATGWDSLNTPDLAWLEARAEDDVIGSASARAWLYAYGDSILDEQILLPDQAKSRIFVDRERGKHSDLFQLQVHPNPSNGTSFLLYQQPEGVENTTLLVSDMTGRIVERSDISAMRGVVELNNKRWPNGLYILEVLVDEIPAGSVKLVVTE